MGLNHDGSFIVILHGVGRGTLIINGVVFFMVKLAFERGQSTLNKFIEVGQWLIAHLRSLLLLAIFGGGSYLTPLFYYC